MDYICIEEMRTKILKNDWPLSYNNWPRNLKANSLAVALGLPVNNREFFENFLNCYCEGDAIQLLEVLLNKLGLAYRKIYELSEKSRTEYVIILYSNMYGKDREFNKFYLARIELDNTIAIKPSWFEPPQKAPLASLKTLGSPVAYFAIRKP